MRELLTVQDGGGKDQNGVVANGGSAGGKANGDVADGAPLVEEEVEGIRKRTAAYLLGEGRYVYLLVFETKIVESRRSCLLLFEKNVQVYRSQNLQTIETGLYVGTVFHTAPVIHVGRFVERKQMVACGLERRVL